MKTQKVEPTFGMAIIPNKDADRYIRRMPYKKAIEFTVMKMDNKNIGFDVYLKTVKNKFGTERLQAEIGHKTFTETFWTGPIQTTRKAADFAKGLWEKHLAQKEITKDMKTPNL